MRCLGIGGLGCPGPWANRVIACLWGLEEELNGNNWDGGAVNSVKWPGRPWGELPQVEITHQPSSYQGWCSNMGSAATWDFDLQGFSPPQPPTQWTFGNDGMIKLTYGCKDYGGTDEITVDLLVPGWFTTVAGMSVPQDRNNNNIADVWESKYVPMQPDEDVDKDNAGVVKGDGLSNFDEYRGFDTQEDDNVTKKHVRTNPLKRDVFVYDPDNIFLNYRNVLKNSGTGINYYRVFDFQMGAQVPTNINPTRYKTGIIDYNGRNVQYTAAFRYSDKVGYPARSYTFKMDGEVICLDSVQIVSYEQKVGHGQSGTFYRPYLEYIVAHEMGHKYGLEHNERYLSHMGGFNQQTLMKNFSNYQYYEKQPPEASDLWMNIKWYKYHNTGMIYTIESECLYFPNTSFDTYIYTDLNNDPPYQTAQYRLFNMHLNHNPYPLMPLFYFEGNIMDWAFNFKKPQTNFKTDDIKTINVKSK